MSAAHFRFRSMAGAACIAGLLGVLPCSAQITPPNGPAPPNDTPSIKVGVLIFADYTVQQQPKVKDADNNAITLTAFQIGRSYINVTGHISHSISFRVTPDIVRDADAASSLDGSYTFRLKFAYVQWSLDDHTTRGSFARFGVEPTPWVEFIDGVYRYRFQGQTFEDREGILPSSDAGASFHYSFAGDYGDAQAAIFNGETFSHAEVNDQKSLQLRATIRPMPSRALLHGLRLTAFWDRDAYVKNADRRRAIAAVTFEHPRLNAGFNYLAAKDRTSAAATAIYGRGWSAFVTPRTAWGWEGLLRFDHLQPSKVLPAQTKNRAIAGIAYWFPHQGAVASALLLDIDNVTSKGFTPAQPTVRKIALHALVSF